MTSPQELRDTYELLDVLIGEEYDEHMAEVMPQIEKWLMAYHALEEVGKRPEVIRDEEAPGNVVGLDQLTVEVVAVAIADDLIKVKQVPGMTEEEFEAVRLSSAAIAGICIGASIKNNKTTFKQVNSEQD